MYTNYVPCGALSFLGRPRRESPKATRTRAQGRRQYKRVYMMPLASVLRASDRILSIPFFGQDPTVLGQPLHRPDDALACLHGGETAPPRHPCEGHPTAGKPSERLYYALPTGP